MGDNFTFLMNSMQITLSVMIILLMNYYNLVLDFNYIYVNFCKQAHFCKNFSFTKSPPPCFISLIILFTSAYFCVLLYCVRLLYIITYMSDNNLNNISVVINENNWFTYSYFLPLGLDSTMLTILSKCIFFLP